MPVETVSVEDLTLYYDPAERESADLIGEACKRSVQLIHECWGLYAPDDCRVYVMTSWSQFLFRSAPWPWRILLGVTLPLWYSRVKKTWSYAGGWTQRYGSRVAVGVKPPQALQLAYRGIGDRIFVRGEDTSAKIQHIACHELVHAFSSHLRLPLWLNEGLAMLTVDKYVGKPTVRDVTIETLSNASGEISRGTYRDVPRMDEDTIVYHTVRGYWITRYFEDVRPGLLKTLLSQRRSHEHLEGEMAAALTLGREGFWRSIDALTVSHFKERNQRD